MLQMMIHELAMGLVIVIIRLAGRIRIMVDALIGFGTAHSTAARDQILHGSLLLVILSIAITCRIMMTTIFAIVDAASSSQLEHVRII